MDSFFQDRKFWSDNVILGLATMTAGLFNTLYSVVLAHALGPADYGRIAALNNIVGIFLLPLPLVGLFAIRLGKRSGRNWLGFFMVGLGLLMFLLSMALSPVLARTFHLSVPLVVLFAASVILNFGYALYIGFLERARSYLEVGALMVASTGLSVLAVMVAVTMGHKHPIFWLGILQGGLVVFLYLLAKWRGRRLPDINPVSLHPAVIGTTIGVGSLQALWGMSDSLLAKAHLSTFNAGLYTGIATIGQALPFIVGSAATVMLTAILDDEDNRLKYLGRTLALTGILAAVFLLILFGFPSQVVRIFLGPHFLPITALLWDYGMAMTSLSFVVVLTTYGVAVGDWWSMIAGAFGTLLWIFWMLDSLSMQSLVHRTLWSMFATLAAVVLVLWKSQGKGRPQLSE